MNDRLAGFCMGVGFGGLVGALLMVASIEVVARVGVVALLGCFILACVGAADWWNDHRA